MGSKVPAFGPDNAKIIVVGEAPGQKEELAGRPFVGPAGEKLREYLMGAGIDPTSVFYTNICKYRPPNNKLESFYYKGGLPQEIVLDGLIELRAEINRIRPNIILAAGNFPMFHLTGKGKWSDKDDERGYRGVSTYRGSIFPCSLVEGGPKVLISYHPSYILQEGYKDHGVWKLDLERLQREAAFPEIRRPEISVEIDPRGAARQILEERLLDRSGASRAPYGDLLTFDIEFLPKTKNLLCVGVTDSADYAAVIVNRNPGDVRWIQKILESGRPLCAQNAVFDASILEWYFGMSVMRHLRYDTMLAAHAAYIEWPKSLDFLASIYTDQPNWKDMVDWGEIQKGRQKIDDVWQYNAIDVWTTHKIMEEQIKWELNDPKTKETFDFETQLVPVLWEMSRRGVRVDGEAISKLSEQAKAEADVNELVLSSVFGSPFNVMSNIQVAELLYEQLGFRVLKRGKTGPACDDKTLAALHIKATTPLQKQVITLIRQTRKARSLRSKFTEVELDEDGRLRGHYSPAGTNTGRLAAKKFFPTGKGMQQQNIPRPKPIRRCFIPDRGKRFAYADLEKAESLVVSYITGDPEMLRVHGPGKNAHKELGMVLFDKPDYASITDDEYYLAKRTRHAGNYMQGPKTFMTNVNQDTDKTGVSIDFAEAKRYINLYRELHNLQPWWRDCERQWYDTKTFYNMLGRRRVFWGHLNLPDVVAFEPQSTVGDTLNVGLLQLAGSPCAYAERVGIAERSRRLAPELRSCGFELLMQIHDAVAFQYDEDKEETVLPIVRELMEVPLWSKKLKTDFTIPVEIQAGPNWGDCKVWTKAA